MQKLGRMIWLNESQRVCIRVYGVCHAGLWPSRLPSIANRHPFVLLRLVYSENEHVHQLALKALAKYSHYWSGRLAFTYHWRAHDVILLVHGQVTVIFVVTDGLSVCLFLQSSSQPSLIRFRSNLDTCYMSGSSCVP